jgi:hypothetical protein
MLAVGRARSEFDDESSINPKNIMQQLTATAQSEQVRNCFKCHYLKGTNDALAFFNLTIIS